MRGSHLTLGLHAAVAAAALGIAAAIVPDLPPLEVLGGDAPTYAAMAEHPFEAAAGPPAAQRLLVPWLVGVLPFGTARGFTIVAVLSMIAAGVVVALICRRLGLSLPAQAGAAALVTGSYIGVHAVYNQYYVDPETLLLTALAFLLVLHRRLVPLAAVLVAGVLTKEIVVSLVVLPYLVWREQGRAWDRRAALRAAAVAAPVLVVFAASHLFAPELATTDPDPWRGVLHAEPGGIVSRGFLTSVVNPIVALFGAASILWPIGLWLGPEALRRAHIWALLAAPVLVLGSWERTLGVFLPLAVPAALYVLRGVRAEVLALFVAGSFWTTGIAGAMTIGDDETTAAFKLALVAPGFVVAWGALAWELSRRIRDPARVA